MPRCFQGHCIIHDQFKARELKEQNPDAAVLVHPESPASVIELDDEVGSTSQLIKAAKELPQQKLIVATDRGIFYKMQQACPEKEMVEAPTGGATCRSCAHCPWMAMNGLMAIKEALTDRAERHEIHVDEELRVKALIPLDRMLNFAAELKLKTQGNA